MKSFLSLGILLFALTFCGLGDRLKSLSGEGGGGTASNSSEAPGKASAGSVEKPKLTAAQQSIQDGATEVKWDEQGITWKLPSGWPKMEVRKESLNYGSPANGFLIASISTMPSSFPSEESIN